MAWIWCVLFLGWLPGAVQAGPAPGPASLHLLVVHAYGQEYPWTRGQHQGFVARLEETFERLPRISVEYLDTKERALDPDYVRAYARFLKIKYAPTPPDAIYVTDDNGLLFALGELVGLYPDAPVFFSGVNDFSMLQRLDGKRVTGVFEKKEASPNIDLLKQLSPGSREVLVLGDGSNTYDAIAADVRQVLARRRDVRAQLLGTPDMQRMAALIARQPDTPLLLTTLGGMRDPAGRPLPLSETLERIAGVSRALIISMEDAYLLPGVHGGFVTSAGAQGRAAAGLLTAWHAGRGLGAPVVDSPNEYVLDASELQRLGLDVSPELRRVARIVHPLPGFFERHQSLLLSVVVLMSGVLMVSVFLLVINRGRDDD